MLCQIFFLLMGPLKCSGEQYRNNIDFRFLSHQAHFSKFYKYLFDFLTNIYKMFSKFVKNSSLVTLRATPKSSKHTDGWFRPSHKGAHPSFTKIWKQKIFSNPSHVHMLRQRSAFVPVCVCVCVFVYIQKYAYISQFSFIGSTPVAHIR
jgi:hypothetical protein